MTSKSIFGTTSPKFSLFMTFIKNVDTLASCCYLRTTGYNLSLWNLSSCFVLFCIMITAEAKPFIHWLVAANHRSSSYIIPSVHDRYLLARSASVLARWSKRIPGHWKVTCSTSLGCSDFWIRERIRIFRFITRPYPRCFVSLRYWPWHLVKSFTRLGVSCWIWSVCAFGHIPSFHMDIRCRFGCTYNQHFVVAVVDVNVVDVIGCERLGHMEITWAVYGFYCIRQLTGVSNAPSNLFSSFIFFLLICKWNSSVCHFQRGGRC